MRRGRITFICHVYMLPICHIYHIYIDSDIIIPSYIDSDPFSHRTIIFMVRCSLGS